MAARDVPQDVLTFLDRFIESVPALEALLLLWDDRRRGWSAAELAARVYLPEPAMLQILRDLQRYGLVAVPAPDRFAYEPEGQGTDALMERVATAYRTQLIPITTYLHARPPASVREFARAFDFKKER